LAFLLLNYGSSHVTVSEGSLFANFSTVISIVAGIFIVHEPFSWAQIVGALFILGSVYIANVNKK
jgi:drug/metabolite transporter (DMT)-like permease